MKQLFKLIAAVTVLIFLSACQNEYKRASRDEAFAMAELLANNPEGPENQAILEIMYSMVELGPDGFKLNATKQDFIDRGVDTYWYYCMKDSLKETYKTLKKGKIQVPSLEGADMVQVYIETFNKQKEEFWASRN